MADGPGTSADPKDLSVVCDCGQRVEFETLFAEGVIGACEGRQPWLGQDSFEADCKDPLKVLIRGATNAYFPQVASVISLPIGSDRLETLVRTHLAGLSKMSSPGEVAVALKFDAALARDFEGFTVEAIFTCTRRLLATVGGDEDHAVGPPKVAEFDLLASGQAVIGFDSVNARFHATTLNRETWARGHRHQGLMRRVAAVHRLREVLCLYGFTRLEPAPVAADGDLEEVYLAVEGASLGDADWLPAIEQLGEGIFIEFEPEGLASLLAREAAQARVEALRRAYRDWTGRFKTPLDFPGGAYALLHSLAHALMAELALECGYPATALRERVYALPVVKGSETASRCGILIYTAGAGAQGSLGGLVASAPSISDLIRSALEKAQVCSNDPICTDSHPDPPLDGSLLNGAACHGCILAPETSCEFRNMLLDRALLLPLA